jgi:hypothetical protein
LYIGIITERPSTSDGGQGTEIPQDGALLGRDVVAWYCDSVSILRKLLQAPEKGIGKAAFWALGAEDPRLREMLEDFSVPFLKLIEALERRI